MLHRWSVISLFLFSVANAQAETLVERGDYLVNSIMACGSCHTPRSADGDPMTERAFAGGITIKTPAFITTASNITPDAETGIGS